jgi:G3E family GTPase
MKKIKVILVTGFLGSGKTSFLKFLLDRYSGIKRVAVIQNEFNGTGVDAKELQQGEWKFSLIEINNGSIFCVCQFSNFRDRLDELHHQYDPDMLIIEATGLADPLAAGSLFNNDKHYYLSSVVCIVDAVNFNIASKAVRAVNNQIKAADKVLINKSDLVSQEELRQVREDVALINPFATILETSYSYSPGINMDDQESLFERPEGELSQFPPDVESEIIRSHKSMSMKELDEFMKSIPSNVIRIKGYIKLEEDKNCMIQYVMGRGEVKYLQKNISGTELVKISFRVPSDRI